MLTRKILSLLTALLVLWPAVAAHALTWYTYNGHEYALSNDWIPWVNAEQEAVSVGGHLATINDAAENSWLALTFNNAFAQCCSGDTVYAGAYIGYNYDNNTSTWQWISGEPVTYTNLYFAFPDGGTHAYLHTSVHAWSPETWNAAPWHTEPGNDPTLLKGIIERSAAVPEPSTLLLLGSGIAGLAGLRKWKGRK